jgi:NAD(P)-dependent dehydrogenase (short-subunit alcohol dehydrogenase family)
MGSGSGGHRAAPGASQTREALSRLIAAWLQATREPGQSARERGRSKLSAMLEEEMASERKSVIVTGAASGIGLAMTVGLVTAGHDVTAADRNAAGLAELRQKVAGLKGSVEAVAADFAQPDSFAHVAGAALIRYGRIDALVNNAGIGQASVRSGERRPIRFWETTHEQWARFIAINAAGPINMARAVLPHMLAAKSGRIITVTTSLGTMVREGYLLYGSSKAAAEAAMAVLAADLAGTGVTSNVLVPGGMTDTPLVGEVANRDRMLKPAIMVPPLLFLLSDEARTVNAKRFVAADWDTALPAAQAAEKAGVPIAWLGIARMPIEPT